MPYLQLDVTNHYPLEVKRDLARRLGNIFARDMQTTPDMVTVAFRELGEGGVWRCGGGEPEPAAPNSHAIYDAVAHLNNERNWPRR